MKWKWEWANTGIRNKRIYSVGTETKGIKPRGFSWRFIWNKLERDNELWINSNFSKLIINQRNSDIPGASRRLFSTTFSFMEPNKNGNSNFERQMTVYWAWQIFNRARRGNKESERQQCNKRKKEPLTKWPISTFEKRSHHANEFIF